MCDLLVCPDPRIVTVCLEGLENILKIGEADKDLGKTDGVNVYAQLIDEAEGLEKIENLQSHDNTEIYEKAVKILETYWLEEEEDVQLPSADATFDFGGGNPSLPSGGFNFSWWGMLLFPFLWLFPMLKRFPLKTFVLLSTCVV